MDRFPFPSPGSAVHDVNKIIRSDYGDARYMRIALEGMDLWRDDPNMSPFWHNSGVLWSCTHEEGKMFVENYRAVLGFSPGERLLSEDVKERFDGIYSGTNFDGVEEWFYNPMGGWADTAGALNRVLELAVQVGVQYISDAVKALLFDSTGKCTGVRSDEGRVHEADSVVLCTGAYTAKLLADSAPTWKNLQVGSRMVTAAACMCLFTISNEDREKFKDCPLICHDKGAFPGSHHLSRRIRSIEHRLLLSFKRSILTKSQPRASPQGPTSRLLKRLASRISSTTKLLARKSLCQTFPNQIFPGQQMFQTG